MILLMRLCIVALLLPLWWVAGLQAENRHPDQAGEPLSAAQLAQLRSFGPWPQAVPADPGNELSGKLWAEALGQRLFNDTALSGDGTLSCASCHEASRAFSDGRPVAIGVASHVRNSQGLLDVALQRWFGWDGGADSLWAATLRPMFSDIEMNGDIPAIAKRLRNDAHYWQALSRAAGGSPSDEQLVVLASKAIAAYLRTLQSQRTPFDDYRDAVLSGADADSDYPAAARRGLAIFLGEANCHVCHFGPNFSNREFHDTGRPFFTGVGQVDPGRYTGIERVKSDRYNLLGPFNPMQNPAEIRKTVLVTLGQQNFGQWRTPSLRNLTLTAPYIHDGSLATLRDVVDAYADIDPERLHAGGESILKPLSLSERDRQDLVAFLESLSAPSRGAAD